MADGSIRRPVIIIMPQMAVDQQGCLGSLLATARDGQCLSWTQSVSAHMADPLAQGRVNRLRRVRAQPVRVLGASSRGQAAWNALDRLTAEAGTRQSLARAMQTSLIVP